MNSLMGRVPGSSAVTRNAILPPAGRGPMRPRNALALALLPALAAAGCLGADPDETPAATADAQDGDTDRDGGGASETASAAAQASDAANATGPWNGTAAFHVVGACAGHPTEPRNLACAGESTWTPADPGFARLSIEVWSGETVLHREGGASPLAPRSPTSTPAPTTSASPPPAASLSERRRRKWAGPSARDEPRRNAPRAPAKGRWTHVPLLRSRRVGLDDVLRETIEQRDRERERAWSLFLPLAAAFAAVTGYVLFHLPSIGPGVWGMTVAFSLLLFVPIDAALRALLRVIQAPAFLPSREVEEKTLCAFRSIPVDSTNEDLGRHVPLIAYLVASVTTLLFSIYTEEYGQKHLLVVALVFFLAALTTRLQVSPPRRVRVRWMQRLREDGWATLILLLEAFRWLVVVTVSAIALLIILQRWTENREDGAAIAGIVASILLGLILLRLWLILRLDTSHALLIDLRYLTRCGSVTDETAREAFEAIEILRQNRQFYLGTAQRFIRDMNLPSASSSRGSDEGIVTPPS